jgi:C4-type Zn-finger protein
MNSYEEENAAIAAMKKEAETEATCPVCGQVTTQNMLNRFGVHYSANLCTRYRQG